MTYRCETCGIESTVEEGYRTGRVFPWLRKKTRCPLCVARVIPNSLILSVIVSVLFGIALMRLKQYCSLFSGLGDLSTVAFVALLFLSIAIHEFGHALAGFMGGFEVMIVAIGKGQQLASFRLGNLRVRLHPFPIAGQCVIGLRSSPYSQHRHIAGVLAGPLANGLVALSVILSQTHNPTWNGFAEINILFFIGNLIPFSLQEKSRPLASDGLRIHQILSDPAHQAALLRESYFGVTFSTLRSERQTRRASEIADEGVREVPESIVLKINQSIALMDEGSNEEARRVLLAVIEDPKTTDAHRALSMNNLAWNDLLAERPDLLDEADRLSEAALRMQGWKSEYLGTRGGVLVSLGRASEGIPLLHQAFNRNPPQSKALNACHLSMAFKMQGNMPESRRYEELAGRLDPDCLLLPILKR